MFEDSTWNRVIPHVLTLPVHQDYKVSKMFGLKLPKDASWRIGSTNNEILDNYCITLPDGRSIHIKVCKDHYLVHWDWYDPNAYPLKHLVFDAPVETLTILFLIDQSFLNGRVTNWAIKKATNFLTGK